MMQEFPTDGPIWFQWDIEVEGTCVQKTFFSLAMAPWHRGNNDRDLFNITTAATLEQTKENPFFETFNRFFGKEITTFKRTRCSQRVPEGAR